MGVFFFSRHFYHRIALTKLFQDVDLAANDDDGRVDDLESPGRGFSTSGRGGAGNFTTRGRLAAGTSSADVDVAPSSSSLREKRGIREGGHFGRGGAGNNYRDLEVEGKRDGGMEVLEARREKVHRWEVVRDVEMGLKEPEKAHLGREGVGDDDVLGWKG